MSSRPRKPPAGEMSKVFSRPLTCGSLPLSRMNPLPRLLGLALFVVLAVLVALLAAPAWRGAVVDSPPRRETPAAAVAPTSSAARMAIMLPRLTFACALVGVALAVALLFSLTLHPSRATDT